MIPDITTHMAAPLHLEPPHHPRLQEAKIIKPDHLLRRDVRHFVPKLHMEKRPQRRRLYLNDLPFDLSPRYQANSDQQTDRVSSHSPRPEIGIVVADLALLRRTECDTL
jgi:hypothetical protein